ncbi:MAG: hypothetical protein ABIH85_06130 [Candidatus Omnitrophota bacterium]|nr:hypothetical protein [Candidatus Omnitrophota bacterium]MBU1894786.1 hypothetical protein [Candidatus Omnitrophota bacterium]
MKIQNIEKLPLACQKDVCYLLNKLEDIYGDDIISVFVYGSVTGQDYHSKTSDINVAVVMEDTSLSTLSPILKTVKKIRSAKITAPLFLTPSYIKMSLDTFPVEFSTMKDSRCVLAGDDILAGISVKNEDLRAECEYQLKGKILTIRQAYLEQALNKKGVEWLVKESFRGLIPVFQSLLKIKLGTSAPKSKKEILGKLAEVFDIDTAPFLEILHDQENDGKIGGKDAKLFLNEFLDTLQKLTETVDKLLVN